jgi:hypothetical protein
LQNKTLSNNSRPKQYITNKCIVCAIVKEFIIEELPHNGKTKRALVDSLGYSMHAKITARFIYRFES